MSKQSLKIISQMDDIFNVKKESDSTYIILKEAYNRGHEIYYYVPDKLSIINNKISAYIYKISFKEDRIDILSKYYSNLEEMNVILFRQDPPFDMKYITTSYILEILQKNNKNILILNNPLAIRDNPEKIFPLEFSKYMPETLITMDIKQIKDFYKKNKRIILKPLYNCGGADVILIEENDKNLDNICEMFFKIYNCQIVAQRFIENIKFGDKRILFLYGEVIGIVNRIPDNNKIISNFARDGSGKISNLNDHERDICQDIGKRLKEKEIFFTGIDIIDGFLTEINITSPTGIAKINQLYNLKIENKIIDKIEEKFHDLL